MADGVRRVLVPLELSPTVRRFLLGALVGEARRWRVDGVRPPPDVAGLIDWLSGVQAGSEFAVPSTSADGGLMNRAAAARRSGLSVATVKRAIARGDLVEHRVGRRSLISVEDLGEFVAARRVGRRSA